MQERGRRRFDAILDAAAATLVEVGLAGFTVHGVAARAQTSIGSMYHFFPDGESVLRALSARHMEALGGLLRGLRETDDAVWAALPLDAAVAAILDPLVAYMEAHPDLFALPHKKKVPGCEPDAGGLDQMSIEIFDRFVGARTPGIAASERQLRARVVHAFAEGVAMRAAEYPVGERSPLFGEFRVALGAYLGRYELADPANTR
jgi:AcrR family transcriptional regulator